MNVLLGVTGGIAAYKSAYLLSMLKKSGHGVDVVMTPAATEFVAPLTFETLSKNPVAVDTFTRERAYEVEHVALAQKAELAVLAPASANTIAKLACGMADNMLTTVFLALKCPVVIVPAMNTAMYENEATQVNLQILIDRGFYVMRPGEGVLACGDSGLGRMREPEEIMEFIREVLDEKKVLDGKKVLITAGPTREAIDPVRYLTNRSSGRMGYAIAKEAQRMGADVHVVSGPVGIAPPAGVKITSVESAQQMFDATVAAKDDVDIVIACAAVADYAPATVHDHKLKKTEELVIELKKTKDILAELGKEKDYYLVGFAAETQNLEGYAKEKLQKKNLDMIVANDVSAEDTGFDSTHNEVVIFKKGGGKIEVAKAGKDTVARKILQEIAKDMQE